MTLASRGHLNHSNRSNDDQEKPLWKSAQESNCRNFSGIFWKFGNFEFLLQIRKFCGWNWKKWLNRKVCKVLKQQFHGSNPRKTQQIGRSVEIPFWLFLVKIFEIRQEQEKFGGKGVDWWVKSVATKLLIPYDEVGTSVLGRSSRIDETREEHEEHKGITRRDYKDRRGFGNNPRREPPVPQDPSQTYLSETFPITTAGPPRQ